MVVRHPLERLLSCYRDKFEKANKDYYYTRYGEKMVKSFRDVPKGISREEVSIIENSFILAVGIFLLLL